MSYKRNSSLMNIGAQVSESAANTFTELEVTLPLNTLDREIFVVTDILFHMSRPDLVAGANASTSAYCSKISLMSHGTGSTDPADSFFLGAKQMFILDSGAGTAVIDETLPSDQYTTGTERDHLGIIATPNFYLSVVGSNNVGVKHSSVRLTGFRAVASADTYAALVTEELMN
jgi:hypothetical protein